MNVAHQADVELQIVGRNFDQVHQPGLSGPEVVVGQLNLEIAKRFPQLAHLFEVRDRGLVDLQGQRLVRRRVAQFDERREQVGVS